MAVQKWREQKEIANSIYHTSGEDHKMVGDDES